jgi:hypothetical protein
MTIRLTFKTPDVVDWALLAEFGPRIADSDEAAARREAAEEAVARYVKDGEFVTIEIDVATGEARVVPVG